MGLFTKKKEEQKRFPEQVQIQKPAEPVYPTFPDEIEAPEFPTYEPTISEIKNEVERGFEEEIDIPIRERSVSGKKLASVQVKAEEPTIKRDIPGDEKPLFVQIEKYKDVLHTLDAIRLKLKDAEELLSTFEHIKTEEDEKLEAWKRDLQNVKDKLLSIDKDLFEV